MTTLRVSFLEFSLKDASIMRAMTRRTCLLTSALLGFYSLGHCQEPASAPAEVSQPYSDEDAAKLKLRNELWNRAEALSAAYSEDAIPFYQQVLAIEAEVLGKEHPDYATSLNSLAALYRSLGDYARAEPLYMEAAAIREKIFGKQHPSYAASLNNLALLYMSSGDYARAESLFAEATAIEEKVLGKEHPDYATGLNNLALLYDSMGEYARSEPLYLEAKTIWEKAIGKEHPNYAASLNNLAGLYESMGDIARAEPLYLEAKAIWGKALGTEHPDYALSLNNLALLYMSSGDIARAEPLYLEAKAIRERVLGKEHPDYSQSLNNLAALYFSMGDTARAEPLYLEATAIDEKVLGKNHSDYAIDLSNLAALYRSIGDNAQAEPLFLEATAIVEKLLGRKHPDYATSLYNLAGLYMSMERSDEAIELCEQGLEITRDHLSRTAYILSERQQLAMNQMLRYRLDSYLACCLKQEAVPKQAVEQVIMWKGETLVRQRELRLAADNPAIADQFKELQRIAQHLYALTKTTPEPNTAESWRERVAKITADKERLESQLMRSSSAFGKAVEEVTLASIQQSIPRDAVLIDFLEYRSGKELRLLASVVRSTGDPIMLDLGTAHQAGEAIAVWRLTFGLSPQAKAAGLALREQLWQPLLMHIGDAKMILISPDGVLGKLPFAALPGKEANSYLIEDHRIALVPVPRLLPGLVAADRSQVVAKPLLMGGVDYDAKLSLAENVGDATLAAKPWSHATNGWSNLKFSGPEVRDIGKIYRGLKEANVENIVELDAKEATEVAFRNAAPGCTNLHLATHGFFAPSSFKSALAPEMIAEAGRASRFSSMGSEQREVVRGFSPGQLSGLVFAGANNSILGSDGDDGIMTADEIAFLPLGGVQLAVLSACQTGLGDSAGGEGLLGVQRAFQVAGVDSTIATLWSIDDPATSRMMTELYRKHLQEELGVLDALRETQLWALNNPNTILGKDVDSLRTGLKIPDANNSPDLDSENRLSPKYWAPFVLSGDWR